MLFDERTFKSFFEDYFEPVFQFALKYTEDEEDARDIAQESFIKLHERRDHFDAIEKAKSFVYTTARNLCLDLLKHRKIEIEYAREIQAEGEEAEEQFFTEEVTYQELLRLLRAAINRLPSQTREVILAGLDGKNNKEIAEQLNVTVNTVKTLKQNAYKMLRKLLGAKAIVLLQLLIQ